MQKPLYILEAQQFDRTWLLDFFPLVHEMDRLVRMGGSNDLAGKRMISLFEEPSTRTRASFEIAMHMLGGSVVFSTENAMEFSSRAKGESVEDTITVLCGYHPDVIVYRSKDVGVLKKAIAVSHIPIINAGEGNEEHPTQALLDLYTIRNELGQIDGISIAMVGDLAKGRTVRSLSRLLTRFSGIKIYFVSPTAVRMRDDIKEELTVAGISFEEESDLRKVAPNVDVIYQTRVQKERGSSFERYEQNLFQINQEILNLMKDESIVMHPLPRVNEILPEVDDDVRAAYFRQAENGLYVRMALLTLMLT